MREHELEHRIIELERQVKTMSLQLDSLTKATTDLQTSVEALIVKYSGYAPIEDLQPIIDKLNNLKLAVDAATKPTE